MAPEQETIDVNNSDNELAMHEQRSFSAGLASTSSTTGTDVTETATPIATTPTPRTPAPATPGSIPSTAATSAARWKKTASEMFESAYEKSHELECQRLKAEQECFEARMRIEEQRFELEKKRLEAVAEEALADAILKKVAAAEKRLATATILPGLGGDPTYIRPGRRPGPSPVPGSELSNTPRTRRQTAPHTHNASQFSLAHDDGAADVSKLSHSPLNNQTGTQAAGTSSPKSSFNIISPPSGTGGSDPKSPTKRLSAMKNRSSINFGESEAPSTVKPQRRVNSALGNQSSFVIGDGGMFPVADQHEKASRYTGKMNNSTIVFGDDGGPVNTASRIPVPTKKMSAVVPGGKAATSLAEFAGFHEKSAVSVRETRMDPSKLEMAAGVVSGKHRIF
ncbi:hypothetical protein BJ741DRAFT_715988 [Chytriomyces cf. hyalinus JEL632]|nr:hypothetical protein BJ741DRAFT_715988 [Chytriomyces cf. hyalinus JEL632]